MVQNKGCGEMTQYFSTKNGVSKTLSTRAILTAKPVDYKKNYKMSFGGYGQEIHEKNSTNTTTPRTHGIKYLQALYILHDGFEVMNLLTGKIITRCKVIPIQITQEVIYIVENIAKKDGTKSLLKSKDRKEGTISEDDDENNYDNASITGVGDEDEE